MRYRGYPQSPDTSILVLIAVNLVLFIAVRISTGIISHLWLDPGNWTGKPWTVLTCIFTHYDIWHIFANMLTLYFLGRFLNLMIGDRWFLTIYFIGGIIGSFFYILFSTFLTAAPYSPVLGASGAIFAVGGALVLLAPQIKVLLFFVIPMPLWVAIIGGFLIISFLPGVAWEAHLGGLVTGLAIGYYLRRKRPRRMIL
jgi:membrane associated rhomboid family serine protease